ncbi:uncharacterized protein LOC127879581 isoform X2 [Dreissena polymorpha]|nr:uncharacterized protein LOC127879581 isoform X2 [Dreissena polymorpha]
MNINYERNRGTMSSEGVANRALTNVTAISWIVRFIMILDIVAGGLSLYFKGMDWLGIVLVINTLAALCHPMHLPCVFSQKPEIGNKPCRIYGKLALYVWLFVLNCTLNPLFIFMFIHSIYYHTPAVVFILLIVYLVTSLVFTVVNLYTFCVLYKYGCCFMYSLRQDLEMATATVEPAEESI